MTEAQTQTPTAQWALLDGLFGGERLMSFTEWITYYNHTQSHTMILGERLMFHGFLPRNRDNRMPLETWWRYWHWFEMWQDFADERDTQRCALV